VVRFDRDREIDVVKHVRLKKIFNIIFLKYFHFFLKKDSRYALFHVLICECGVDPELG
jgi:hypothetical protein